MKQVQMYYRSGTGEHCCIGAAIRFALIHQVAAIMCVKWRHGRHLEKWR